MSSRSHLPRRDFLKLAGTVAAAASSGTAAAFTAQTAHIVVSPDDRLAAAAPVAWAAGRLQKALMDKGVSVSIVGSVEAAKGASHIVVVSGDTKAAAGVNAESVRIEPRSMGGAQGLVASSPGVLGLVYGLTELADRVACSADATLGLHLTATVDEKPANEVRSAMRAFCSEIEDKGWYNSKDFWRGYLDALVTSRFNRFNFAFGFGYDFPKGVTGDYFHFPFPYLVTVPGYDVRVVPLADGERERNMEMLRFIASETALRGMQFQLGIWTLAYEWTESPKADHHVEGLSANNHAEYSRDALAMILKECPQISGVTLRVHGESGIPEGSYDFWRTVMEAIAKCGRRVEIDMHAKGINQIMIDMANATGMPVKIGAKFWAEHMGLGYHQTDIRELEIPTPERMETGVFSVSNGERRFTRYGYADLYQEDRKYNVLFRLWPGTQHHLLWGDPATAAAYSRTAHFCGAAGLELCEPLTFKGREGSGHPGGRCAYVDAALEPANDWEKFAYTYRLWGRMLYNPETPAEVWRRSLTQQFGPGAAAAEMALSNASRVLPLLTTAHLPSASNHSYWPEMYTNMAIVPGARSPYSDTPKPARFGTVSPLDPQLFSSIDEYVKGLLEGRPDAKYSPLTVAAWMEGFTTVASSGLASYRKEASRQTSAEYRRWEEDLEMQIGMGLFFAWKLRAAVAYEIFLKTGDALAGGAAVIRYTYAREVWAKVSQRAVGVYKADVSYGDIPQRRGHWADRLPAIDADLAAMRAAVKAPSTASGGGKAAAALRAVSSTPARSKARVTHTPAAKFTPGQALPVSAVADSGVVSVELFYRHVNQGERWKSLPLRKAGSRFSGAIPAEYTQSVYPLQYYFVLRRGLSSSYHPEFNETLSNEPYFAVWRRS